MALSLMMVVSMSAQSAISLTSSSGRPGDEVEVSVMLSNAQTATALQIIIPHSPYLSYVDNSAKLNVQRVSESHVLAASDKDNQLSIYVYDSNLNTFKEGTGAFITFRLKLDKEPGTYELKPQVLLSDVASQPLSVNVQSGSVTILTPKISLGQTEVDFGRVPIRSTYTKEVTLSNIGNESLTVSEIKSGLDLFTVSPASMTIAAGQQKALTIKYSPLLYGSDFTDITIISDASNGKQTIHVSATPYSVNILSVADASGKADEEVTISVSMQNMEPIVAAQCCFTLPEALKYVAGSAALSGRVSNGSHKISETIQGNKLSFYIHSGNNTAISGNDGELFTFKLLLDGTGGNYPLEPTDVLLSNISGRDMTSEVNGADVRIAAPKLECEGELDFGRIPMEETATARFTIKNIGESPLVIQRVEFADESFSLADATDLPNIAPGKSSEIEVCYRPSGEGEVTGVMRIYNNDPQNRMQIVEMTGTTYATNKLALSGAPVSGQPNQYALTVSMQNSLPIVAMQFDLHWIAGMEPVPEAFTLSSRATKHKVEITKLTEDCYRVYVYSMSNNPIVSGDGPTATLIYNKVEETIDYDQTSVLINQIILSTVESRNCASSPTATCHVGTLSGILGDVNNDGVIDSADGACIAHYLLGIDSPRFTESQADMNQDQEITITDAVQVINAIK